MRSDVGGGLELVNVDATCPEPDCGDVHQVEVPAVLRKKAESRRCPRCSAAAADREAAEEAERQNREREEARAGRIERLPHLLLEAGANPWEHGRATLENFDASESGPTPVRAIRQFVEDVRSAGKWDPVRGLYLFGDTGLGKSHLAVAVLREFLADPGWDPAAVVFDHSVSLIAKIQDTYNTGESTQQLLDTRIRARLWILDDLGSERASEDVVQRLTLIFTERAMRPTLVTSNDPPDRLEQRHPELKRVQSRLGPAYFRTVRVKGRDRRFEKPDNAA